MHRQINFTKCSPTQHLAYSIEGKLGDRWNPFGFEWVMDDLHDTTYLLASGTKLVEVFHTAFKSHLCFENFAIECSFIDVWRNISDWGFIFFGNESLAIFFHFSRKLF